MKTIVCFIVMLITYPLVSQTCFHPDRKFLTSDIPITIYKCPEYYGNHNLKLIVEKFGDIKNESHAFPFAYNNRDNELKIRKIRYVIDEKWTVLEQLVDSTWNSAACEPSFHDPRVYIDGRRVYPDSNIVCYRVPYYLIRYIEEDSCIKFYSAKSHDLMLKIFDNEKLIDSIPLILKNPLSEISVVYKFSSHDSIVRKLRQSDTLSLQTFINLKQVSLLSSSIPMFDGEKTSANSKCEQLELSSDFVINRVSFEYADIFGPEYIVERNDLEKNSKKSNAEFISLIKLMSEKFKNLSVFRIEFGLRFSYGEQLNIEYSDKILIKNDFVYKEGKSKQAGQRMMDKYKFLREYLRESKSLVFFDK
jgi:hypothetical protein